MAIAGIAAAAFVLAGIVWYVHFSQTDRGGQPLGKNDTWPAQRAGLSIMVLPFANGTGDPQQAYIADGLTASVTSDLSRIREAFVVSATTAYAYKDKPVALPQIGKDLGVRFVLQGSVQRSSNKIRITAQLSDTTTNAQLWSENFEGDESDLFALQDQVTSRVGNSIGREMFIAAARDSEKRKSSPNVTDLILRAKALRLNLHTSLKNWQDVESLYRQVLALEPKNVSAMVGLSISLSLQGSNYSSGLDRAVREKKFVEGRDLALMAKELDPDNPGVYVAIGIYAHEHNDYATWRRASETWLAMDPKNPLAYGNVAIALLEAGDAKSAIELIMKGISLDPKHSYDQDFINLGYANFMNGDNDAAIEWYHRALETNPTYSSAYAGLAMLYSLKGDDAKARAAAAEYRQLDPNGKLSDSDRPPSSFPAAYKEWFDKKYVPAWRKAGLPE